MQEFREMRRDPGVGVLGAQELDELRGGEIHGVQEVGAEFVECEGPEDAFPEGVLLAGFVDEACWEGEIRG